MTIKFECPTGAHADVKELEYISALHQSDPSNLRQDGSIDAKDISTFLLSRFGIDVTEEQVQEVILPGLSCSNGSRLNLMEIVSILCIPTLLNADPDSDLLEGVLERILQDNTGGTEPKLLNPDLLRLIFNKYGICDIARNEEDEETFLAEMITEVFGDEEGITLNVESFTRALTHDVWQYDHRNVNKFSLNLDDVKSETAAVALDLEEGGETGSRDGEASDSTESWTHWIKLLVLSPRAAFLRAVGRDGTLSAIDLVAGTHRSKVQVVSLWAAFLVTYFTYYWRATNSYNGCPVFEVQSDWSGNRDAFYCQLFSNVRTWLITFVLLSIYGLIFLGMGSAGNGATSTNPWYPLFGMGVISCCIFVPMRFFDHTLDDFGGQFLKWMSILLGLVVVFIQLTHVARILRMQERLQERLQEMDQNTETGTWKHFFLHILQGNFFSEQKRNSIANYWKRLFRPGNVLSESRRKKAAEQKISLMIENAFNVFNGYEGDNVDESFIQRAFKAYSNKAEDTSTKGGIFWTIKGIRNKTLVKSDGISLSARFVASNVSQFILATVIAVAGFYATKYVSENYDFDETNIASGVSSLVHSFFDTALPSKPMEELQELVGYNTGEWAVQYLTFLGGSGYDVNCTSITQYADSQIERCSDLPFSRDCAFIELANSSDSLCQIIEATTMSNNTPENVTEMFWDLGILNQTGFDSSDKIYMAAAHIAGNATAMAIRSLYPEEKYMLVLPFLLGTAVAFFVAMGTAVIYTPSIVSTIFKLRSGVIPTLTSGDFVKYRHKTNQITQLSGFMFWGIFFSSLLCGALVGFIVFVSVWQVTRHLMLKVLAIGIGVSITLLIKFIVLRKCKETYWRSLYRTDPKMANLIAIVTECANFALSVAFAFIRMAKLVFVAALYVGRVDTFFFAPGVGKVLWWDLDDTPSIFLTDVLVSEAHRHPYLERLGTMYLMKLHHQDFGTRVGSVWRLIFVTALMPWLQRHCYHNDRDDEAHSANCEEVEVMTEMVDDEGNKTFQPMRVSSQRLIPAVLFQHGRESMSSSSIPIEDTELPLDTTATSDSSQDDEDDVSI